MRIPSGRGRNLRTPFEAGNRWQGSDQQPAVAVRATHAAYAGVGAGQRGKPAFMPREAADKAAPSRAYTADTGRR